MQSRYRCSHLHLHMSLRRNVRPWSGRQRFHCLKRLPITLLSCLCLKGNRSRLRLGRNYFLWRSVVRRMSRRTGLMSPRSRYRPNGQVCCCKPGGVRCLSRKIPFQYWCMIVKLYPSRFLRRRLRNLSQSIPRHKPVLNTPMSILRFGHPERCMWQRIQFGLKCLRTMYLRVAERRWLRILLNSHSIG